MIILPLVSLTPACGDSGSSTSESSDASSASGASEGTQTSTPTSTASGSEGTNPSSSGTQGGSSGSTSQDGSTSTTNPTTGKTTDDTTGTPGTTGKTTDATTTGKTTDDTTGKPDTTGNDSDGVCSPEGKSCAQGELCCGDLDCCMGVPVPQGEEFCSSNCPISDRNKKRDFLPVDTDDVLERVAALPLTTWSYKKDDPSIRHIGPMAQDFQASFRVGASDRYIFQIDADGVSLAATQALYRRVKELDAENQALRASVDAMERRLAALEAGQAR